MLNQIKPGQKEKANLVDINISVDLFILITACNDIAKQNLFIL